ncbi:tRNA (guanine-N(7)-)-methyltransferase non-catalytic subunit wdr4 [Hippocampus comes]|uniref:tRNA (guanine-N(7)-)-methyltransferase non-catalytic subunit wdr4 n=1 Tax=Hippocampus comes TaxID=109280 RepID=UPI00094EF40A|nr:PREDICTED: tRNA (guanine-N(7)-)-methyltransferase non-catalytic subunit WDR4 [Hippocampus comes]
MALIGVSGEWMFLSCGTKLIAAHIKQDRSRRDEKMLPFQHRKGQRFSKKEPFVFDCSTAKKRENDPKTDDNSLAGTTGSDVILAFIISPSGKLVALTDDSKRLILLQYEHSWQCVSTRWLVRRGTSLVFNRAEDEVLVADKSGDVYSFSVMQPEREGELKMGHLSMILAVAVSPNDKYIVTADRDEKIRVSHLCSPHSIQSFCLGHKEFVSSLLVPSGDLHWLLSGSGDGTMKLWEYTTGQKLKSWDLNDLEETLVPKTENEGKVTVCHITSSSDGRHIAVQCDRVSCFYCETATSELKRVTEIFKPHWVTLDASTRAAGRFVHLHKVTFDNMTVYMNKKQQRLEEQQQKRKMEQGNNGKKARKEVLGTVTAFSST